MKLSADRLFRATGNQLSSEGKNVVRKARDLAHDAGHDQDPELPCTPCGSCREICVEVSETIASQYDLIYEHGYFSHLPHAWLRRRDGTILDATPEQFGWSADYSVVGPEDRLQHQYWTTTDASPPDRLAWAHRFRTWGFGHPHFDRVVTRSGVIPSHSPYPQSEGLRLS